MNLGIGVCAKYCKGNFILIYSEYSIVQYNPIVHKDQIFKLYMCKTNFITIFICILQCNLG
jgi:hypothetical protein